MLNCEEFSTENPEGSIYCLECGEKIRQKSNVNVDHLNSHTHKKGFKNLLLLLLLVLIALIAVIIVVYANNFGWNDIQQLILTLILI